jgi:hypothetical protein
MFLINFQHYFMLRFCGGASCNKIIVDFNLLAVLLYILSTRVRKICAHVFLVHVYSGSCITRSFSLTVNDHKRIHFVLIFGDNGHNTPHTMPSGSLLSSLGYVKFIGGRYTLAFAWVTAGRSSYSKRQQCHQYLSLNKPCT